MPVVDPASITALSIHRLCMPRPSCLTAWPILKRQARAQPGKVTYGRHGTPTRFLLEEAVAELEGGYGTLCVSSGVAAITNTILAFVKPAIIS